MEIHTEHSRVRYECDTNQRPLGYRAS